MPHRQLKIIPCLFFAPMQGLEVWSSCMDLLLALKWAGPGVTLMGKGLSGLGGELQTDDGLRGVTVVVDHGTKKISCFMQCAGLYFPVILVLP